MFLWHILKFWSKLKEEDRKVFLKLLISRAKNHNIIQPAIKVSVNKVCSPQMHLAKVFTLHILLRFAHFAKEVTFRAYFATFASLKVCKIILNVRIAHHYLQINLGTIAMLACKLGPCLFLFFDLANFIFLRVLYSRLDAVILRR